MPNDVMIDIRGVTMAYGSFVVMRDINAQIRRGEVFIIMGGSGCGKSTLLRCLIGLKVPARGDILYADQSLISASEAERQAILRKCGVLFQSGALWSSLTLAENVAMPLKELTSLGASDIAELVQLKLALVGLSGFEEYYPSEISGGMRKRAGLARAMALDPEILFFDEPSAGLDPLSSRRLDDLILELRSALGTTVVVVTHELASIFAIGDDSIFLDAGTRTVTAFGNPRLLRERADDPAVRAFLCRGAPEADSTSPDTQGATR